MDEHNIRLTHNQKIEGQRREAVRLLLENPTISRAEIGRRLGVDRTTVSGWLARYEREGEASIATKQPGGRHRTTPEQRQQVEQELLRGALAHGFPTDLWTLDRMAIIFERVTGVRYNPGYVWQLLHDMGWTCQKPEKQARRRNEAATQRSSDATLG